MKQIFRNSIENIPWTQRVEKVFLCEYMNHTTSHSVEIIHLWDILKQHQNTQILTKVSQKPAMYSEVYSPKVELEIFTELFEKARKENKKIHVVGVTLAQEIQMLERYYEELGFLREDINAFDVDFSVPLVTVSCCIENLMWRGSDYKRMKEQIFFCPPIRESGQNKALFKGITRGVIAGIELWDITPEKEQFLGDCIRQEKILPLHMGRILKYNYEQMWLQGKIQKLHIQY